MDLYREGKGVENNIGIYNRVQKVKEYLKNLVLELKESNGKNVFGSSKNKILVVTHSRVLQSFSAKGVEQNVENPDMGFTDRLVDPTYFQNCEIVPYFVETSNK